MTVHAVKVKVSKSQESNPSTQPEPGPPDWVADLLKDRVDQNVLGDLTEKVSGDRVEPELKNTASIGDGGTDYIEMVYRFDKTHSKTTVLNRFENKVVKDAEWFKIEMHTDCSHDEPDETRTECGDWVEERSKGTVPEGV